MACRRFLKGVLGLVVASGALIATAVAADGPEVVAVPGRPTLPLGSYDVASLGYRVDEFFVSGTATSYKLAGEAGEDGKWDVVTDGAAPYTTRIVVVRPSDPAKFSGTAIVEWLNVTAGQDLPIDWTVAHREIVRRGHAYVGVSAQKVGIEGGGGMFGAAAAAPAKKVDPERYARIAHPGDAYAFDIFSQAGRAVKDAATTKALGPLVPKRVLAAGVSQSALYLTTYANAVDPLARVYDGMLIHLRFAFAVPPGAFVGPLKPVKLRLDLRVPVLTVITETEVDGGGLMGFRGARQPDNDRLRVWEVAGTSHADTYTEGVGRIDFGSLPAEKLAAAYAPTREVHGVKLAKPMNFGPQHHYMVQAAFWHLDRWLRTGQAPPVAPPLDLSEGERPKLVTDANGLAKGGFRTPWVDVPTATLSGVGNSSGSGAGNAGTGIAGLVGVGEPFDAAALKRLYPGGKAEYLRKFEASLDATIKSGFILPEDRAEILELAALSFAGESEPAKVKE